MSAEEDASGSEEDEYIRSQLKELSGKGRPENKGLTVKHKRLSKRSSSSHDDDPGRRHSWHDVDDDDDDEEVYDESPEAKYRETKSQDNEELSLSAGGGLRRFKTIDLNSTITNKYAEDGSEIKKDGLYYEEEPELEMESLTDSPEDRSRGEGSSSLHATSSFTPGTSPTSVSSLDEDSDSSPSHKKMLGESKQQRKARHRSPGPLLPTIEDSSEEEELREEEELLREQEKQRELEQQQRKSSTKKSKKDKDELRAQRRREHPKTPPSNLSPIEDASPTEELRQAAEMEELHRSSCSEYSPSIESEPEGFEIHPEKIIEVQKVYKLPTSVSLYSPTDENASRTMHEVGAINQKSLKSAEEAYEEMMQKAKFLKNQKEPDDVFDKEPLYGGMLIEDYIYESLVEDNYNETMDNRFLNTGLDTSTGLIQETEKKLRSPDEIYEEIMKKNTNLNDAQCYHYNLPLGVNLHPHDLPSSVSVAKETFVTFPLDASEASTKIEKQLLDADAAYEEIMKRQSALLTPGTSPTQLSSPDSMSAESEATNSSSLTTGSDHVLISVPPNLDSSDVLTSTAVTPVVPETSHLLDKQSSLDSMSDKTIALVSMPPASVRQPASTLPEDRYGYRDDHYSYGHGATHGYRGFGSMKPSMSDTNLAEAGLFLYKSKHSFDYCSSSTDAAMDLTAGKLTAEREMLEFEKMKQIRLAEELERERHEIQIFREQEKLIVQRELQELQTMKQQLLYQQEEERQAQFMIQQETIAQQQMQLEQIQQLQQQLQQQLEEQKIRQIYQYTYDPSGSTTPQTTTDQVMIESQYTTAENGQFWHGQDISTTAPAMMGQEPQPWYTAQSEGIPQHLPQSCMLSSVSEMSLKDIDAREGRALRKRSSMPRLGGQYGDDLDGKMQDLRSYKKIVDSGVQTDDEEGTERCYTSRRRRTKKSVDSSVQTDDEDNQEDWDIPIRRRKSRVGKYTDGGPELEKAKRPHFAKLSNIAMQTVAEIS
eukprot:g47144.t1